MVEMPTRSALATASKSTLRKSSTKSSTSQPCLFIIVPRMRVPSRGSGNWEKMWRFGAFGSIKTILGMAAFLFGGLGPLRVPGLEGVDVLFLLLELVAPALDAFLDEFHAVGEADDGLEHGRQALLDLGRRVRVEIGFDGQKHADVIRD